MPPGDDILQPLLDAARVADDADPASLIRLWQLANDPNPRRLDEFLETLAPSAGGDEGLYLRAGEWSIDLRASAIRTAVLTALVAGVLIPRGLEDFAVGFVTVVLPTVLDIERVKLDAGDRRLLVELRAKTDLASEDELYAALPPEVQSEVNRYDFANFIERLRDAGFADSADGGAIQLRTSRSAGDA